MNPKPLVATAQTLERPLPDEDGLAAFDYPFFYLDQRGRRHESAVRYEPRYDCSEVRGEFLRHLSKPGATFEIELDPQEEGKYQFDLNRAAFAHFKAALTWRDFEELERVLAGEWLCLEKAIPSEVAEELGITVVEAEQYLEQSGFGGTIDFHFSPDTLNPDTAVFKVRTNWLGILEWRFVERVVVLLRTVYQGALEFDLSGVGEMSSSIAANFFDRLLAHNCEWHLGPVVLTGCSDAILTMLRQFGYLDGMFRAR